MGGRSARFGAAAIFVALGGLGIALAVMQPTSSPPHGQTAATSSPGSPGSSDVAPGASTEAGGTTGSATPGPGGTQAAGAPKSKGTTRSGSGTSPQPGSTDAGSGDSGGFIIIGPTDSPGQVNPNDQPGLIQVTPGTSVSSGPGSQPPNQSPAPPPPPPEVTQIQMATSADSNGNLINPRTTFSTSDTQIYCALALQNIVANSTTIHYEHIYPNGIASPSSTFLMKSSLRVVFFEFQPSPGSTFQAGNYKLYFFLNNQLAQPVNTISYTIK